MAEKYGQQGETDPDGFDPYADTVGPGIYGGKVQRDDEGKVVLGRQYQNHNRRPGPVYTGACALEYGWLRLSRGTSPRLTCALVVGLGR